MSKTDLTDTDTKTRLQSFMDGGLTMKQEIKDLSDSLKDLTKTVAEELTIKAGALSKALNVAFKNSAADETEANETVTDILVATGHA